jgi:branched-chain amino acid transport system ATP-binding protein
MSTMARTKEVGQAAPVLEARAITAGYGPRAVIKGLDLVVRPGEVVALLGANGAGKTTTLLALSGELPLTSGEVEFNGQVTKAALYRRARNGMAFITEERSVFRGMSTRANLRVADVSVDDALALFPELERRLDTPAGLMSGGEQQMLIVARALSRRPRLMLADELSLGLAPLVISRLLQAVRDAADNQQTGVLLVEQHVRKALEYADRGYVLRNGVIVASGDAAGLRARIGEIEDSYLAAAEDAYEAEA